MNKSKTFRNLVTIALMLVISFILIISIIPINNANADTASIESNEISIYEDNYYKNEFKSFLSTIEDIEIDYDSMQNKILYGFEENTNFILTYTENTGYMISNRITGTSYEKCASGKSPYQDYINIKCYYFGFGQYYVNSNDIIINVLNNDVALDEEMSQELKKELNRIMGIDLEDNGEINFFARTSEADRINNSKYISEEGKNYFTKQWSVDRYYYMGDGNYDYLFPDNIDGTCAIVAAIQLLQYLDRFGIVDTTSNFKVLETNNLTYDPYDNNKNFSTNCLTQLMHDELWEMVGEKSTTNTLVAGLNSFLEKYEPLKRKRYPLTTGEYADLTFKAQINLHKNACYDNMMGQIDSGKPAIGGTGATGNGYYQYNGKWTSYPVDSHAMIVYGYCTTDKGTLKDFITHSGWRSAGTEKMYVYKLNFLSNITYDIKIG